MRSTWPNLGCVAQALQSRFQVRNAAANTGMRWDAGGLASPTSLNPLSDPTSSYSLDPGCTALNMTYN